MLQLILLVIGALAVCVGVAWIYPPAGLIVAGLGVCTFSLLWDRGER